MLGTPFEAVLAASAAVPPAIHRHVKVRTVRHRTLGQRSWTLMQLVCPTTPTSVAFILAAKIARVGRDRDRSLVFRGWNRLCLHAASISAAVGASASATAAARATRSEAMEPAATAAADKVEALKRATAASANLAVSREQAQPEATELARRGEAMSQVDRQQQERRAKMLVRRSNAVQSL